MNQQEMEKFVNSILTKLRFNYACACHDGFDSPFRRNHGFYRDSEAHRTIGMLLHTDGQLKGQDWQNLHVSDVKMVEADFSQCKMKSFSAKECFLPLSRFNEADLGGAVFADSDLSSSEFVGASLVRARFRNVYLQDVSFKDADLTGAQFIGADLRGASFDGARLDGVLIIDSTVTEGSIPDPELIAGNKVFPANMHRKRETRKKSQPHLFKLEY